MQFEGKTLLVTGAASGIGRAIARAFHTEGARVVAVDLSADELSVLSDELDGLVCVQGDVSSPEDVARAVEAAEGPIDVLCNVAGMLDELRPIDEMSFEFWKRVMSVNLDGAFLFTKAALPAMIENGGGVVINMSSTCGLRGGRGGVGYTTSKHALIGFSRNIAGTYRFQGIRSNAICPGSIRGGSRAARLPGSSDSVKGRSIFVERDRLDPEPGTPEHIAAIAVFLASPAAVHINGTEILADGGALTF